MENLEKICKTLLTFYGKYAIMAIVVIKARKKEKESDRFEVNRHGKED